MSALKLIADRATEKNLPFLLAGGQAVILHGYQRLTFDLDLVIQRQQRETWINLMKEIGYELFHEGPTFIQFNPPSGQLTPVDMMLANEETFQKFIAGGVQTREEGAVVTAVSVRHLLALKCHAIKNGHPGRIVRDADDVIHLILANRLDIESDEWRELILKYGTADLYEKLRHACKN